MSGGQTGADRAALAWAVRHGIPHDGWCPRDRWSESGPIPRRYCLRETPSSGAAERTLWNVRDSDGTVILSMRERLFGGTAQTAKFCIELGKPMIALAATVWTPREAGLVIRHFVHRHGIRRLNIAGPRASEEPDVAKFVKAVLDAAAFPGVPPRRRRASA